MRRSICFPLIIIVILLLVQASVLHGQSFTREKFINPPIKCWPRPLWFWNNTEITADGVVSLMEEMRNKCGYGGFGVVPSCGLV